MGNLWKEAVVYAFRDFVERAAAFVPSLVAMIFLIALGILLSWVAMRLFRYLLRKVGTDRWSDRWGLSAILRNAGLKSPLSQLLSLLLFWILLIPSLMIGISALQIQATSLLISRFFGLLLQAIVAVLIVLVGWIVANFLGHAALIGAVNARIDFAPFIARAVRWGTMILASAMALIHLGIAQQMVVAILSILFGGLILALALAFGLGGKELARQFLEKKMRKGEGEEKGKEEVPHL